MFEILFYVVCAIGLCFILNRLDNKNDNSLWDSVIVSGIYILVLAGIFKDYSSNIFLVVLFYSIFNIMYISYVREVSFIKNNKYEIVKCLVNVIVSYLLNVLFINKIDSVFLDVEELRLIIWLVVVLYLYKSVVNIKGIVKLEDNSVKFYLDREYIVMRYAKYKNKYGNIVSSSYKDVNLLIYAIMIYESYKRNEIVRKFDEIMYKLFSLKCKFGIMQVDSKKIISNEESVERVLKRLVNIYEKNNKNISSVISKYYKNMNKEVESIYLIIRNFVNE